MKKCWQKWQLDFKNHSSIYVNFAAGVSLLIENWFEGGRSANAFSYNLY